MTREHSYDPADGFPQIMPSLRYDDVGGALAWLSDVFGLREYLRWSSPDGVVHHAEIRGVCGSTPPRIRRVTAGSLPADPAGGATRVGCAPRHLSRATAGCGPMS